MSTMIDLNRLVWHPLPYYRLGSEFAEKSPEWAEYGFKWSTDCLVIRPWFAIVEPEEVPPAGTIAVTFLVKIPRLGLIRIGKDYYHNTFDLRVPGDQIYCVKFRHLILGPFKVSTQIDADARGADSPENMSRVIVDRMWNIFRSWCGSLRDLESVFFGDSGTYDKLNRFPVVKRCRVGKVGWLGHSFSHEIPNLISLEKSRFFGVWRGTKYPELIVRTRPAGIGIVPGYIPTVVAALDLMWTSDSDHTRYYPPPFPQPLRCPANSSDRPRRFWNSLEICRQLLFRVKRTNPGRTADGDLIFKIACGLGMEDYDGVFCYQQVHIDGMDWKQAFGRVERFVESIRRLQHGPESYQEEERLDLDFHRLATPIYRLHRKGPYYGTITGYPCPTTWRFNDTFFCSTDIPLGAFEDGDERYINNVARRYREHNGRFSPELLSTGFRSFVVNPGYTLSARIAPGGSEMFGPSSGNKLDSRIGCVVDIYLRFPREYRGYTIFYPTVDMTPWVGLVYRPAVRPFVWTKVSLFIENLSTWNDSYNWTFAAAMADAYVAALIRRLQYTLEEIDKRIDQEWFRKPFDLWNSILALDGNMAFEEISDSELLGVSADRN